MSAPLAMAGGRGAFLRDLRTWPNVVSFVRVVFIYVGIGLWYYGHYEAGLAIGVVGGLSDYLDGYLARRLNQSTRIGALVDQAADVLYITGVIFLFVRDGTWPAILLFVFLFRETIVMNLRASAAQMGFSLPSTFLGKWASNWIFYALALIAAHRAELLPEPYNTWVGWVAHFGVTVGIISSVVAGGIYLKSYASQYVPLPKAPEPPAAPAPPAA